MIESRFRYGVCDIASWFLPVLKGSEYGPPIRGWEAFHLACCAVWPCEGVHFGAWYYAVLATVSAITTLLLILGSPWVVLCGSRSLRRACAWTATVAFIFNSHWYVLFGSDRSDLRIGYFLWWLSFLVLALGLFVLTGRVSSEATQGQAALLPR
jgi:hypothetical protein